MQRVRVVIATPLGTELVDRLRTIDDRLDIAFEPELLPPRYPSDHAGDETFERTQEQEERFAELVRGAEVVLGFPGETPAGLAWVVRTAPGLRFLQATYAGAGQQLRAAKLSEEELARVAVASSAGIHATPLAEWSRRDPRVREGPPASPRRQGEQELGGALSDRRAARADAPRRGARRNRTRGRAPR